MSENFLAYDHILLGVRWTFAAVMDPAPKFWGCAGAGLSEELAVPVQPAGGRNLYKNVLYLNLLFCF